MLENKEEINELQLSMLLVLDIKKLLSYLSQKEQMLMLENKEEINVLHLSMLLVLDVKKLLRYLLQKEQM